MDFNNQDATRVRLSLVQLLPKMDDFSLAIYDRLFEIAPAVRPMFSDKMDIQREKLVATLSWVASNAPKLAADTKEDVTSVAQLRQKVRELGRRHRELGVEAAHYGVLKGVMVDVLHELLGTSFDTETEEAWGRFYDVVAAEMNQSAPR